MTLGAAEKHCATCRCGQPKRKRNATGIKRTTEDARFSRMIRARDDWQCQRCGKVYEEGAQGLHSAHMFSRRIKATRTDPANACALCMGCHIYLDTHPIEKIAFFRERLGDEAFDALEARAHAKRDRTHSAIAKVEETG